MARKPQLPYGTSPSLQFLLNGGYIRPLGEGIYSFLPLGFRVLGKIEAIIRQEMEALGGQEMLLPLLNPPSIWEQTGRGEAAGDELVRVETRNGERLVLAVSHEEAFLATAASALSSTDDLPLFLYQIQLKYRDEMGSNLGLLRAKEFRIFDGFSLHRSFSDLNNFIPKVFAAYERMFQRCHLEVIAAEGAAGLMADAGSYDFLLIDDHGEDHLVQCQKCGYQANQDVAVGLAKLSNERPMNLQSRKLDEPMDMCKLPKFFGLPNSRGARCQVFISERGPVAVVHRCDHQVSLVKLSRLLACPVYRAAGPQELKLLCIPESGLSPIAHPELFQSMVRVVDSAVVDSSNLVHNGTDHREVLLNGNFGRDYSADTVGDVVRVNHFHRCYHCGGELEVNQAIKVGSIRRLNAGMTENMGFELEDRRGGGVYPFLGSYMVGVGRLMASIVEAHSARRFISWPPAIAPYKAILLVVGRSRPLVERAQRIHEANDDDVLFDDRDCPMVEKLSDARRLGIPMRIMLSASGLSDGKATVIDHYNRRVDRVALDAIGQYLMEA